MSLEVALSSVESIFRVAKKYRSSNIYLKYMGGEPLIAFDKIPTISEYAKKLGKENNIKLHELIVSNGILLNIKKIRKIEALNINLTISLDGLEEDNSQRVDSASTKKVTDAINLSIEQGVLPNISIVVTQKNINGLPRLVSWILERELKFSILLARNSIFYQDSLWEEKIVEGLLKTFKVIEANLPKESIIGSMFDMMNPLTPHQKTCGAGENYMVFNPKGEISKCQMDMKNSVATYKDEDPIKRIREDKKFVKSYEVDEIEECKECDIRYFCTGGCPMQTYYKEGQYKKKSPNCNIYKAIYPSLLRLEGMRMLKNYR
jgi:uncharacterized protein